MRNGRGVAPIAFIQQNSLILLLSLAAAATFVWLLHFRERLRMTWYAALGLSLLHVAIGVFCVKAFAILEGNPPSNGAMSLFGAVFFMPLAYWLGAKVFKRSPAEVFDVFALCMIFTLMCARVNCLISGCCQGRMIPGLEPHRWPTRELELIYYAVFLILVAPRVLKGKTGGRVYPIYMMSYGLLRSVLECFRVASTQSLFHLSHIWALLSLAVGLAVYLEINSRILKGKTRRPCFRERKR